jgi:hypothetical protein
MKLLDKAKALSSGLGALPLETYKLGLVLGLGRLAMHQAEGNAVDFQAGIGVLALSLTGLSAALNFEIAKLEKPSQLRTEAQVLFHLTKAVGQIGENDFYSGCAEAKYWLDYLVTNFATEVD